KIPSWPCSLDEIGTFIQLGTGRWRRRKAFIDLWLSHQDQSVSLGAWKIPASQRSAKDPIQKLGVDILLLLGCPNDSFPRQALPRSYLAWNVRQWRRANGRRCLGVE